jgi:hypothetical protein
MATSFTLTSPTLGDTVAQPILDLVAAATPQHATLPNYDTDRNADPGLTLIASLAVLESTDPEARQVWRLPADLTVVPASGALTLWVAPVATLPGDELHIRVGVFDCDEGRTSCVRLVRDTMVVPATGAFAPLVFDVSPGTATPLAPGRRAELRVAVPSTSDVDVWIAYDTVDHPAALTLGP